MKNIICFLSGIVAGIAMCLTAAYYLPESSFDDSWATSKQMQEEPHGNLRQYC